MSTADYIEELYDEIDVIELLMRAAKREYHGYVKMAAWSPEICARVDEINAFLEEATQELSELRDELAISPTD